MSRVLNTTVTTGGRIYPVGTPEADVAAGIPDKFWDSGSGSGGGYADQNADALKAEADRRGLEVEGTGKDGNVLKADLVSALEAHDKA